MAFFLFVLGFSSLVHFFRSQILIDTYHQIGGAYYYKFNINNSSSPFYLRVDLSNNFLWICGIEKKDPFEKEGKEQIISLSSSKATIANKVKGSVHFHKNKFFENFQFFYAKKESLEYYDSLGLGLYVEDKNLSFIHQLKEKKYINQLKFGFGVNNTIYFGEIPKEMKHNKYKSYCNSFANEWGCELTSIKYGDFTFYSKNNFLSSSYLIFQTAHPYIQVPIEFFSFIKEIVLKKFFEERICYTMEEYDKMNYFCKCSSINKFPNISFFIEDKKFEFHSKDIFYQKNDICVMYIEVDYLNYHNKWVLGTTFLKKYNTLFDYELKKVYFYGSSPFINHYNFQRKLCRVLGFLLLCGISFTLLIKKFKIKGR